MRRPPQGVAFLDNRSVLVLSVLVAIWLATRIILFVQMHDAAGIEIDGLPEFIRPRKSAATATAPLKPGSGSVHVVLTSNGNSYMNWQTRVMYGTYLAAVAKEPGGPLARGAFTRVLHRSTDDELMAEVPTLRFRPAHVNCDVYCSFPVADRAPALVEWVRTEDAKRCSHVLLVETDYIFVRGVSDALLPPPGRALAFPFSYIIPSYPSVVPYSQRYYPPEMGPLSDIPPTGNAPVLLTTTDLQAVLPEWSRVRGGLGVVSVTRPDPHWCLGPQQIVTEIENDEVAVEALGWVRDMYAWSFAVARLKLVQDMPQPPNNPLMVQPPADKCVLHRMHCCVCAHIRTGRRSLGLASILHYTWGPVVHNKSGAVVWEVRAPPHRPVTGIVSRLHAWARSLISAPTAAGSMRLGRDAWSAYRSHRCGRRACICRCGAYGAACSVASLLTRPAQPFFENGAPVTREGLELMRLLVHTFNAAVDTLPELPTVRVASGAPARATAEPSFGNRASRIARRRRRRRSRRRSRSASRTRYSAQ